MLSKISMYAIIVLLALLGASGFFLKKAWADIGKKDAEINQLAATLTNVQFEKEKLLNRVTKANTDKRKLRVTTGKTIRKLQEALDEKDCGRTAIGITAHGLLYPSKNNGN